MDTKHENVTKALSQQDKDNREIRLLAKQSEQGRLNYLKHRQLLFQYDITLQEYNRMFERQNGCCAICGLHQTNFKRSLHIDHNHKTGEIRELLCPNCNTVIGKVREDVNVLTKIASYIEKWNL